MKIETKYDIGQEVWVMLLDEPTHCTIEGISVTHTKLRRMERYYVVPNDYSVYGFHAMHDEICLSKEELLKSL
jgi:hypothetical protein